MEENELKNMVTNTKERIKKLPEKERKRMEDTLRANIIYNSVAIEEETLPKKESIQLLMNEAKGDKSILFK